MTTLVAPLGYGKGTWVKLFKLIDSADWETIILVAAPFFAKRFAERGYTGDEEKNKKIILITIDSENMGYTEAIGKLSKELSNKVLGVEVALNLLSGTGKEHMIILSSLLKLGFGIRLVDIENNEMKDLSF